MKEGKTTNFFLFSSFLLVDPVSGIEQTIPDPQEY